jgi:hypothetical protein
MKDKIPVLIWHGCYDSSWSDLIVNDAFAHPAKFSRNLIERIYEHMEQRGWIEPGDLIGDMFGGVGLGGIVGAYRKYLWVGMEIEPRFVEIGNRNFQLHKRRWRDAKLGDACLVKGDSRQFHLGINQACGIITSPPYAGISPEKSSSGVNLEKQYQTYRASGGGMSFDGFCKLQLKHSEGYGKTDGQIAILPEGKIDAVMTSPPYADISTGQGGLNSKPAKKPGQQAGRNALSASQSADKRYGDADGQISKLPKDNVDALITSPPYAETGGNGGGGINKNGYVPAEGRKWTGAKPDDVGSRTYQGLAADRCDENVEKLRLGTVDAVMTSPPYGETLKHGGGPDTKQDLLQGGKSLMSIKEGYGKTHGQIDSLKNGTVDSVITSPPWESNAEGGIKKHKVNFVPTNGKGHHASPTAREAQLVRDEAKVYGNSEGQIGILKGSKETCSVCGTCLPLSAWQIVEIAASKLPHKVNGVENVAESMLVPVSKEGRKRKSTKQRSLQPISTFLTHSSTEKKVVSGKEGVIAGEDLHGEFNVERHCKEIITVAKPADQKKTSLFTTKKTNQKPEGNGITACEILKRFAEHATINITQKSWSENIHCCAKCADVLMSQAAQFPALALSYAKPPLTQQNTEDGKLEKKQTYWSEMLKVYESAFIALKPGGVAAIVLKDYVKDKKRVPLSDDTCRLLEHIGFIVIERVQAMLVKDVTHGDLFEGETTKRTSRKSFFRRLAESKGSPKIDFEDVIFAQKPYAAAFA